MADPVSLLPGEGVSLADIEAVLLGPLGCHRSGGGSLERTYYDTFDGRVFRAGMVIEHERIDGRRWLRVRHLGETTALAQAALQQVPARVTDLADRRLRELLAAVVGERALLPLVSTEGEVVRFAPLDEFDKTTVRVSVVVGSASAVGGSSSRKHLLEPVITIAPVRGHGRAHRELVRVVSERLGQRPAAEPLRRAAGAVGVEPGVDPADRSVSLDAGAPAADAVTALLCRHAAVLEAVVAGVRTRPDDEFLHDFRVTLRSARAIVAAADGVLGDEHRAELAASLQRFGTLTSPVRDLDVLRGRWIDDDVLRLLVPALDAERDTAHQALCEALDEPAFDALLAGLRAAVPAGAAEGGDQAPASAATWAAEVLSSELDRLHRRARRIRSAGALLGDDGSDTGVRPVASFDETAVHDARKAAKRLRYLLDAFGPLDRGGRLGSFRRALRELQADLGEFQDAVVTIAAIEQAGAHQDGLTPETLMELGRRSEQHHHVAELAVDHFVDHYRALARRRRRFAHRIEALAAPTRRSPASTVRPAAASVGSGRARP